MAEMYGPSDAAEHGMNDERTPSYADIDQHVSLVGSRALARDAEESPPMPESPYTMDVSTMQSPATSQGQHHPSPQHQSPQHHSRHGQEPLSNTNIQDSHITSWGLSAALELESDTVEIYDRSSDDLHYSLKGSIHLNWINDLEVLLKDARIDFMGYADTAVLRYEAGGTAGSSLMTETPVHHTHDFIPTPLVLGSPSAPAMSSSRDADATPPTFPVTEATQNMNNTADATTAVVTTTKRHESLPIDLSLPGYLPDSIDLAIGKIRYELQVSLEVAFAQGTSASITERFILRRPVLIHRIVYPSVHLQPRMAQGLDSGGVDIQIKVPRLLHCENTLLAIELYAKPRTRNVKLRKAKVVFEQIETDRYQRTAPLMTIPKAAIPLASSPSTPVAQPTCSTSATSPPLQYARLPIAQPSSTGPPPPPRLLTRAIAQPMEVEFEEATAELQPQDLRLQLVLSPDLCVDVQSSWIQISHTLRVEVEYTTDEDSYIVAPPSTAPPVEQDDGEQDLPQEQPPPPLASQEQQEQASTMLWEQEGDAIETEMLTETGNDNQMGTTGTDDDLDQSVWAVDEKKMIPQDVDASSSTMAISNYEPRGEHFERCLGLAPASLLTPTCRLGHLGQQSTLSSESASSPYTNSVATEEILVRVVRVVATALVDATTLAQAAGETEAGLPTYESVIEATGLPAYAEEKLEDDHEEAEASGTVTGVLGGAARRLEGEDAELQRR
ncbi:hypothetical protein EDD11_000630 [Mortierella claussenii]|nr:hypothetical protein EDD11_000630 [Mortierella claussenii]